MARLAAVLAAGQPAAAHAAYAVLLELAAGEVPEERLQSGMAHLVKLLSPGRAREVRRLGMALLQAFCQRSVAAQTAAVTHGACAPLLATLHPRPECPIPDTGSVANAAVHHLNGDRQEGGDGAGAQPLLPGASGDCPDEQDMLLAARSLAVLAQQPGAPPGQLSCLAQKLPNA